MEKILNKKLWGLLAFSPWLIILIIVLILVPISARLHAANPGNEMNYIDRIYIFFGSFYIYGVVFCSIKKIRGLERFSPDKKVQWVLFLLIGSVLALPVFWYKYILKEN